MNVSKTNGVKLFALVAVFAMLFAGATVVFSDDGVDAATGTQIYGGQTLTAPQSFTNVNINVTENLIVDDGGVLTITGGNFTVSEGVTVTIRNGGEIIVSGGLVTINGTVKVTGTDSDSNASKFQITGSADNDKLPTFKTSGVVINGDVSVERGATLVGDNNTANILVQNGGSLDVNGSNTSVDSTVVYVAVGGEFSFSGKIASGKTMTVASYGTSETFTIAKAVITPNAAAANKDMTDLTFTTTSKSINGYDVASEPTAKLVREFALNVNGSVDNLDTLTFDGETYTRTISGSETTYNKQTTAPALYTSEDAAKHANGASGTPSIAYNDLVMGKVVVDALTIEAGAQLNIGNSTDSTGTYPVYVLVSGDLTIKEITEGELYTLGDTTNGTQNGTAIADLVAIYKDSVVEISGTATANYGSIKANAGGVDALGTIAINGGTMTVEDFTTKTVASFFGAYYTDKDDTAYISDLVAAIDAAVAAGEDEVTVFAASYSETDAKGYGGYTISADLTIPDGITLNINNAFVVEEGVTVTFSADSEPVIGSYGKIFVNGTVVDNSNDLAYSEDKMFFQVKIVDEDTEVNTYTSLANALATTTSGTIYLYNTVTISGTMTIPENVTVRYSDDASAKGISFEDDNATLVINGTLYLAATSELDNSKGTVTVNNMIAAPAGTVLINDTTPVFNKISGVYYTVDIDDDGNEENVITSAAVAATNSENVFRDMVVYGKVTMGTVTFTQGEDNQLAVSIVNGYDGDEDKSVATGTVTLVGGATFDTENGAFTGTVTSETSAGATTVSFDKSKGSEVKFDSVETMEGTTTDMILAQKGSSAIIGTITVSAGEVTINTATNFNSPATVTGSTDPQIGKLAVATGATLNIDAAVKLGAYSTATELAKAGNLEDLIAGNVTFDVAGIVNIEDNGNLQWGYTVITGTLNVLKGGQLDLTMVQNDGTIVIAEDAGTAEVELMVINGKLTGNIGISSTAPAVNMSVILVMPGADMSEGTIMWDETNNETNAAVSEAYINGELYATVYAYDNTKVAISALVQYANVTGLKKSDAKYYTDAAMNNEIDSTNLADAKIGTSPAFYIVLQPDTAKGTISQGTGLALYIDNVNYETYGGVLTVGSHTVRFDVKAGYDGTNATITLNGQTVENGGTIEITADMVKDGFTLVASGAVPMDYTSGSTDNGGMGLTEILLIILVILIVVMAIMVALRLMRS